MNDKGYNRRLRMLTAAYESGAEVTEETRRRIEEYADTHSAVHPDTMNADPLTLTQEERRMAGGKTLAKLRK
jgi:hypothetical protein